ncbi:MAG: molybdopterin-synthase adenylyltransferase MoeB [Phaeodactylibacter sp.]|nr:molybdopterin-synthase adenylyltransferase MoeB [Phaeodactylibacter sp.]
MFLSKAEIQRYARHLNLPGFGLEQQKQLKAGKVLVVGAGGLGCPILQYLAAAGVGRIGIIDHDVVDRSNLHRQILYTEADVGRPKAEVAAERVQALNPHTEVDCFTTGLSSGNALEIFANYDLIIDGTDNFPTRYLINDACLLSEKPLIHGAVSQFEGQVAVFNYLRSDGSRGPNYRDLFPTPPPPEAVPNCAEAGVLGVLPGIIGNLQAIEALKVLLRLGEPLDGQLLLFDALGMQARKIRFPKLSRHSVTELLSYAQYCGPGHEPVPDRFWMSPQALYDRLESPEPPVLVDIREAAEHAFSNIGGQLVPKKAFLAGFELPVDRDVVLYCRSGKRCGIAWNALPAERRQRVYLLEGGMLAWVKQFAPELEVL